jgi:hypothetical protein
MTNGDQSPSDKYPRVRSNPLNVVELLSHDSNEEIRLLAREVLRLRVIERAYCAANDYINALATPSVSVESLDKIKAEYWKRVREVQ